MYYYNSIILNLGIVPSLLAEKVYLYKSKKISLTLAALKVLPAFLVSFIQCRYAKPSWTRIKQECSWDMFKFGQTALRLKVDKCSSFDFQLYGKVRGRKLRVMTVGKKVKEMSSFTYAFYRLPSTTKLKHCSYG